MGMVARCSQPSHLRPPSDGRPRSALFPIIGVDLSDFDFFRGVVLNLVGNILARAIRAAAGISARDLLIFRAAS